MSFEVSSIQLIEDPSEPRSLAERQSLMRAMILRQTDPDPEHRRRDADADATVTRKNTADQSLDRWKNIGDGGTAQGLELKEVRSKEAQGENDSATAALKEKRGDYYGNNPAPAVADTGALLFVTIEQALAVACDAKQPEQTQPQPLTTNTIAQLFDGLPFPKDRWVKNISAAKWLITAKRGLGEQGGASATWCPLTIAQLVYGHEKDARAKQKTLT